MAKRIGIITDVERLDNSYNGNPAYRVVIAGTMYETYHDAGWVYALDPKPGLKVKYETEAKVLVYAQRV